VNHIFDSPLAPLVRKLESVFKLSQEERDAIEALPIQQSEIKADQDIVREGDRPTRSFFVMEGVMCTYKTTGDGRRQIVNFHIPGDGPDLQSIHLTVLDISIATMTPCKVAFARHESLRELCANYPRIAAALWRHTLIDAAIFRAWMTSIGQRPAPSRIAHLMCEMFVRVRAIGLADGNTIGFPITQTEIGDALGLSTVHVNRSIQELRGQGLISLRDSTLTILDWDGLQAAGDFDPTYLHLQSEATSWEPAQ
jgi:CRP-like cAMP-binding protein